MNRTQLEHVLRAAADVVGVIDLVVLGSQAILGSYEDWQLPEEATRSTEADVAVDASVARVEVGVDESALADLIDGALGEGSQFHAAFGYYAQGVETATAILATGWRDRLVPVICDARDNTGVARRWLVPRDERPLGRQGRSRSPKGLRVLPSARRQRPRLPRDLPATHDRALRRRGGTRQRRRRTLVRMRRRAPFGS